MQKAIFNHSTFRQIAGALLVMTVAGCTTSGNSDQKAATTDVRVTQNELQAFCPQVSLREGTAFFSSYEKGGDQDANRLIYQASLADVTRDCRRNDGNLTITVAAAGRVVPGPKFRATTISLPVRVVVMQGEKVLSSTLHKQAVAVQNAQSATQFLFSGSSVSIAEADARSVSVVLGFDEGPYNTK